MAGDEKPTYEKLEVKVAALERELVIERRSSRLVGLENSISGQFIDTKCYDIYPKIKEALNEVGMSCHALRAYLHIAGDGREDEPFVYEWCAENIEQLYGNDAVDIRDMMEKLSGKDFIYISDINNTPHIAREEVQMLDGQGIASSLVIPIQHIGDLKGFLRLDYRRQIPAFDENIPSALKSIADSFMGALDRKRIHDRLRESNKRLEAANANLKDHVIRYSSLVNSLPGTIIYEVNESFEIRYVSERISDITGFNSKEVITHNFFDYVHPDDERRVRESMQKFFLRYGDPFVFRVKTNDKTDDAAYKWVRWDARAVDVGNGLFLRAVVADVDDWYKKTQRIKELEVGLAEAQTMQQLGMFAGGIAHDLNNIFASIIGYYDLMRMDIEELKESYERIIAGDTLSTDSYEKIRQVEDNLSKKIEELGKSITRGMKLPRTLLDYSRVKTCNLASVNIAVVVSCAYNSIKSVNSGKDIIYEGDFQKDIHKVVADDTQIDRLVSNLMINGIYAMSEEEHSKGGIMSVSVGNASVGPEGYKSEWCDVPQGEYVKISVSDTGCGISEEVQKELFVPFKTTKKGKGTGLGMATVEAIVKKHEGYIDLQTEVGKGTTFDVYLPACVGKRYLD